MNEIYWITRFDVLNAIFITTLVISSIILVMTVLGWLFNCDEDYDFKKNARKNCEKAMKISIIPFIIGLLGVTFIPTTKEALLIYGVGGTIDYLKSNPTAKQLPDKCINALDKWIDDLGIERKDSVKN
jgi:heme/copper-type cytochrome/quinol oxidase subunit 2